MKTYAEINEKIKSGRAVVMNAEEIISYVEQKGLDAAAEEVDVVTTATFGPMCSSGCFLNFGHSAPKIRISEAWLDDVLVYSGIAAVDAYLGATQLRHNDPANMYYPGEFRFGGGHVIEKLIRGEKVQLFALSYGTDDYPCRELRTYITIDDLNQAIMVNPRNCYQNYNVAINTSDKSIYTYLGHLKPNMENLTYCSAGQLSPLLNDPFYETIGVGTSVWLAGAHGHVHAEGTQHSGVCTRTDNGVPSEGAGTLGLTGDMKKMNPEFVRGISLKGYGVSLALGIGIPIPVLNRDILKRTTVKDSEIFAPVIDYSHEYPQATGKFLTKVNYADLKKSEIEINGKKVKVGSLSSYSKALKIADILKEEIISGKFLLSEPYRKLTADVPFKKMKIAGN
ncbi:MAG: homocysteine biosynthesis protein [Spirochaetes bacterium]|nr:homocysteine biosynthesis protein [Spirochaetota bacterium]